LGLLVLISYLSQSCFHLDLCCSLLGPCSFYLYFPESMLFKYSKRTIFGCPQKVHPFFCYHATAQTDNNFLWCDLNPIKRLKEVKVCTSVKFLKHRTICFPCAVNRVNIEMGFNHGVNVKMTQQKGGRNLWSQQRILFWLVRLLYEKETFIFFKFSHIKAS
jgi:hypothetical protein